MATVTPASTDQPVAERKTAEPEGIVGTVTDDRPANTDPTQSPNTVFGENSTSTKYAPALEKNILNNYRSWTYNFTIGALPPEAVTGKIEILEENIEKFRVLDSAGKGESGIGLGKAVELSTATQGLNVAEIVEGFNQNSPGRFDLYIDDVEVDSLIGAGSNQSGSSIASNISFTVYEPYSMNGFIEALQVAANAAAYPNYMAAVFALRVRFIGYRDDASLSETPEVIPNSTRYFCITISEIEVDVTQEGTRYKCSAVPYNQMGFGTPNILLSDVKVAGNTVHEVLTNLFKAINTAVADEAKARKGEQNAKHDYYEIACPALVQPEGSQETIEALLYSGYPGRDGKFGGPNDRQSDIIKAAMNDELKEVNVFQMADPSATNNGYAGSKAEGSTQPVNATPAATPAATTANPSTPPAAATPAAQPTAQPTSSGSGTPDQTSQDPATQRLVPSQGTVVFGAGRQIHDCIAAVVRDSKYVRGDLLTKQIKEAKENKTLEVTYFTVRLEVDLLEDEFDSFSNRYYCVYRYVLEPYQIPYTRIPTFEQGEVDHAPLLEHVKREYNYIYSGKNVDVLNFQLKFDTLYYAAVPSMLGNRPDRPNAAQAVGHNNTVEVTSKPSTVAADQKEKPDPQKVPTAQVSTDPAANITNNVATAGQPQADPYYRLAQNIHNAVLNGVDLIQGSLRILGDPYFLVTGGMGNQNLELTKSKYQTVDGQAAVTQRDLIINLNFKTPIDINVGGPDAGFMNFDSKLLPFSGVYRVLTLKSQFKDGVFTQDIDIIRCPGQIQPQQEEKPAEDYFTNPLAGSQIVKDSKLPSILSEGIRESALDFGNIIKRGLPNPGLPGVASNFTNALQSIDDVLGEVQGISAEVGSILNQVSGIAGQFDSLTSQIGVDPLGGLNPLTKGVSLSPSAFGEVSSVPKLAAASIAAAGSAIGNIANISDAGVGLANNVADAISSIPGISSLPTDVTNLDGKNVSGLVSDIGNSISKIQTAVNTDLTGISAKLGIDPEKLAGLSSNLSSKLISQIQQIAELVPENTNIKGLEEIGLYYKNISGAKLSNLPALNPQIKAPEPLDDPAYTTIITSNGRISGTLNGKTALAALTEINNVKNSLGQLASAIDTGLGSIDSLSGQLNQINQQVNSVIGDAQGVTNQVGSLSQNNVSTLKNAASLGLGSVESNINSVNSIVQSVGNNVASVESAVNIQLGSRQTQSPLSALISNSNIKGSTT